MWETNISFLSSVCGHSFPDPFSSRELTNAQSFSTQKDDEDKEENFEQEEDQLVLTGIEEWEAVHRYDLQVTDEWEG